jgi:hypothetical protein
VWVGGVHTNTTWISQYGSSLSFQNIDLILDVLGIIGRDRAFQQVDALGKTGDLQREQQEQR